MGHIYAVMECFRLSIASKKYQNQARGSRPAPADACVWRGLGGCAASHLVERAARPTWPG